jgi:hypothetical protein
MAGLNFWILPLSVLAQGDFVVDTPTVFHVPSMGFWDPFVTREAGV